MLRRVERVLSRSKSILLSSSASLERRLKDLFARLGRAPSLIYVLLYVLVIFIFSAIYYELPHRSFYHSTSQYEREYFDLDASKTLYNLKQEILQAFSQHYGSSVVMLDGWQINADAISVSSLNVKEYPEDFKFKIQAPIACELANGNHIWSILSATVSVPLKSRTIVEGTVLTTIQISEAAPVQIQGVPVLPRSNVLFPPHGSEEEGFFLPQSTLEIPIPVYQTVIDIADGSKGFPTRVSGQYWRMLYLSAGVATSNALGDISPITTLARLMVTVEAVAALIIIGLFLNAIGYDIAEMLKKYSDLTSPNVEPSNGILRDHRTDDSEK